MCKPGQLNEFEMVVKSINDFWLKKVKLPKNLPAISAAFPVPKQR